MGASASHREQIHRHSGWLIPGIFFFALMLLSGLLLGWYLRPGLKPSQPPTGQSNRVTVTIGGVSLSIPANFIESSTARTGGEMDAITLAALFPSWHGYSQAEAGLFLGNAPDSLVIRLSLRGDPNSLEPRERTIAGRRFVDTPADMMRLQRVMVQRTDVASRLRVVNLLGGHIEVAAAERFDDLFIG